MSLVSHPFGSFSTIFRPSSAWRTFLATFLEPTLKWAGHTPFLCRPPYTLIIAPTPTPPRRYRWRAVEAGEIQMTLCKACFTIGGGRTLHRETWNQTFQLIKYAPAEASSYCQHAAAGDSVLSSWHWNVWVCFHCTCCVSSKTDTAAVTQSPLDCRSGKICREWRGYFKSKIVKSYCNLWCQCKVFLALVCCQTK